VALLSIQSLVAYGHVGNAAAMLPLQRQGFEVWPVPTAMLAHHPGYGKPAGRVTPDSEIAAIVDSLDRLGLFAECKGVITGWLGTPANAEAALDAARRVKAANPKALYLCDPVLGDTHTGIYVDAALPPLFRDRLLPEADIVTPNQFELEWLTGRKIATLADAIGTAKAALALGPRIVVCTSLRRSDCPPNQIEALVATKAGVWLAATPELNQPLHGAGDMFAALFLARLLRGKTPKKALAFATSSTYGVLRETVAAERREPLLVAAQTELVRPTFDPVIERVG